jgi:O-antigen/teichoic acid export membrane protein
MRTTGVAKGGPRFRVEESPPDAAGPIERGRRRLRGPALVSAATLVGHVSSGLFSVVAARRLSTASRGTLAVVLIVGPVLSMFSSLGRPAALTYALAGRHETADVLGALERRWVRRAVVTGCILGSLAGAVALRTSTGGLAIALAPPIWVASVTVVSFAHATALGTNRYRQTSLLYLGVTAVPSLLGCAATSVWHGSLAAVIWSYTASTVLVAAYALRLLSRRVHGSPSDEASIDRSSAVLSKYGRRILSGSFFAQMNGRIDVLLAAVLLGASSGGVYSAGASVAQITILPFLGAGQVALPIASRWRSREARERPIAVAALAAIGMGGLVAIAAYVLAPRLVVPVYGARYQAAENPARWLAVGAAVWGGAFVANQILRGLGRPNGPAVADLVSVAWLLTFVALRRPSSLTELAVASCTAYIVSVLITAASILVAARSGARTPDLVNVSQELRVHRQDSIEEDEGSL